MRRRDFLKTIVAAAVLPLPKTEPKLKTGRYAYYAHYLENGIPYDANIKAIWLNNKKVWSQGNL